MDIPGIKDFPTLVAPYIKQSPEDFIVEEYSYYGKAKLKSLIIFDFLPKRRKEYLHCTLVKRNYTTQRAISQLASFLKVSKKRIGFAGTKDKRALTAQKISIWNVDHRKLLKFKMKDLLVKDFKYSDKRIHLGDLYGNYFTIVFRKKFSKEKVKQILERSKKKIPNYFGPQRFGEERTVNHLIGKALLRRNFKDAVELYLTYSVGSSEEDKKWRQFIKDNWGNWPLVLKQLPNRYGLEKAIINYLLKHPTDYANALRQLPKNILRIFLHAYQSYIFNLLLEKLGRSAPDELPLVGYETGLQGKWGEIVKEILEKDNLSLEDFKMPSMPELSEKGSWRSSFIILKNFKLIRKKDYLIFKFFLPKGSYATVVLGELLK